MLVIRMQRLGRKGHPTYRIVVQDSRQAPTSGKVVARLGSYDPHTKTSTLVKDKTEVFLSNGAHPSDRVIRLLQEEGVKLPKWVKLPTKGERTTRNPEKLRKNRPAEAEAPAAEEAETPAEEAPAEPAAEATETAEAPAEPSETVEEAPAEVTEESTEDAEDEAKEA